MQKLKTVFIKMIGLLDFPLAWGAMMVVMILAVVWETNTGLIAPFFSRVVFLPLLGFILAKFLFLKIIAPGSVVSLPPWALSLAMKLFLGLEFFLVFVYSGFAFAHLTYLICSLNFPLVDQSLDKIDKMMGFYWLPWYEWSKNKTILSVAYHCLGYEMLLFFAYFSFYINKPRLYEMYAMLFFALVIIVPLSGFYPALGPLYLYKLIGTFNQIDPEIVSSFIHVNLLRVGKSPDLMEGFKGIITFPSFHAACAVLYAYGFRGTGVVGYSILWLNIFMLVGTLFSGGHYLIDVIAGVVIALLSMAVVRIAFAILHYPMNTANDVNRSFC